MYKNLDLIVQHRIREFEPRRMVPRRLLISASFIAIAGSVRGTLSVGDGGGQWKHWLSEMTLLGFQIVRRDPELIADIVGAISRGFGAVAEWTSGPLGSKAQASPR